MKNNFKFHLPLEVLEKSKNEKGEEIMKIGGIASTSDQDADGEFLDPNGFDVSYFKNQGFFNWHHMAKSDPSAIVGEPTKAEKRPEGLYVEGFLYSDNPIAKSIYSTAKMLEKSSPNRRLGLSIEGKALERDEVNPKIVKKAAITGCAITFMPKNPRTYMDLIKGGIEDDDYQEEFEEEVLKMLSAGNITGTETHNNSEASGAPLKTESVEKEEKNTTSSTEKSCQNPANGGSSEKLEKSVGTSEKNVNFSDTKLEKTNKIMNKKEKELNGEELVKAMNLLSKAVELVSKGDDDSFDYKDEDDEDVAVEKATKFCNLMKAGGKSKAETMASMLKKGYPQTLVKSITSGMFANATEKESGSEKESLTKSIENELVEFKKGLSDITEMINDKNYSIGVILKGIYDTVQGLDSRVESLEKGVKTDLEKGGSGEELSKALEVFGAVSEKLDAIQKGYESLEGKFEELTKGLNTPNQRKSAVSARPVERQFVGGNDLRKGQEGVQISMNNRKAVLEVLDKATFEKGMDAEYADAMMTFENTGKINPKVLQRLASEKGISII